MVSYRRNMYEGSYAYNLWFQPKSVHLLAYVGDCTCFASVWSGTRYDEAMKGVTDNPRLVCAQDNGVRDGAGCSSKSFYYERVQVE